MQTISQSYIESQLSRPSTNGWTELVLDFMRTKGKPILKKDGLYWEKRLYERAIKWPFE